MEFDELKKLNKQAAKYTEDFYDDFVRLFQKHLKKSEKMAIVNMIQLPLNGILNVINRDKENLMCKIFPELPDMFIRFMKPFIKLKDLWGAIPNEEWVKEYGRIYSSQFDEWFPSQEDKKRFEEWFEKENKKG